MERCCVEAYKGMHNLSSNNVNGLFQIIENPHRLRSENRTKPPCQLTRTVFGENNLSNRCRKYLQKLPVSVYQFSNLHYVRVTSFPIGEHQLVLLENRYIFSCLHLETKEKHNKRMVQEWGYQCKCGWLYIWFHIHMCVMSCDIHTERDCYFYGFECVTFCYHLGNCGSCFAFATAAMNEARLRIHTKNTINVTLSPQDVVDCSPYPPFCM